ncbi:hypothetical protein GCM10009665_57410 [Kitasatospora nipponensis]|uniref:HTH cro/C1-type domain-containing protein n=1 Tax=Kitasatospora nipponensis TaxID=258049 RepID=A0ABN1WX39_9ACTN
MHQALRQLTRELSEPTLQPDGHDSLLLLSVQLRTQLDALTAGLVHRARQRRTAWAKVATSLGMSEDGARHRFRPDNISHRLAQFARQRPVSTEPGPPNALTSVRTGSQPPLPDVDARPAYNRLAAVLSMLVRATQQSQRELSIKSGCSASYLSRVLKGERVPTWQLTERLVRACGADPAVVRSVWEAERLREYDARRSAPSPADLRPEAAMDALRSALGTQHVRAGTLTAYDIAVATGWSLTPDHVTALIAGQDLGDWGAITHLLHVLGGDITYFRSLWDAAFPSPPPPSTTAKTIPTASVGTPTGSLAKASTAVASRVRRHLRAQQRGDSS